MKLVGDIKKKTGGQASSNKAKIFRLKARVEELEEQLDRLDMESGDVNRIKKSISKRDAAIKFLENERDGISWEGLEKKFKFKHDIY